MGLPVISVMGQFPQEAYSEARLGITEEVNVQIRKCSCDAGLWKEVGKTE